jgi:crotonobetainyl-CoA:carnitine CoA-transferase CaiB-like acyl-CoA transferase
MTGQSLDGERVEEGAGRQVFAGTRVIDFSQGMAGPLATMVLADYGADVIKVEPPGGDWARGLPGFLMWNRGKRSVVLDLHDPHDVDTARSLIGSADVVLTASPRLPIDDLGLAEATLRARHPRLIHCRITGFGLASSHNDLRAYEGVVAARSGRMNGNDALSGRAVSTPAGRPIYVAAPINSYGAAMLAVQGITAALISRLKTGGGRIVDTSLLDGAVAATMRLRFERNDDNATVTAQEAARRELIYQGIVLTFLTAECADGRYIQMCARQDDHFRNWLTAIGLEALLHDERFARGPLHFLSQGDIDELETLIQDRMLERTQAEWMKLFIEEYDVGADPFLTPEEFLQHPQLVLNDRVVEIEDGAAGRVRQLGPLALLSETPASIRSSAPSLGEHQQLLLSPDADLDALMQSDDAAVVAPAGALPLAGITVIEAAYFLAAPLGATLLAELGATVIKVEPPSGDPFRRIGLEFVHLVHGKRSIAVDLKAAEGRRILHQLLARSDVLLHSFRPGVAERLGMDYETVHGINPRLVYVYGSAYGSAGPQAHRAAFHSTPNALNGGGILQAGRGNPPVDDSYPDPCSGLAVAVAMTLALYARARYDVGQYVETTMLCSSGYVHSNHLVRHPGMSDPPAPDGGQFGTDALYRLYPCAEGWLFLGIVQPAERDALGEALGSPSWFAELAQAVRDQGRDEPLAAHLSATFAVKPAAEWERLLQRHGVPAASAGDGNIEQFLVRENLVESGEHPAFGTYWRLPTRVRFSDSAPLPRTPTACGEYTDRILAELGYSAEEVSALAAAGVVAQSALSLEPSTP